MVVLRRLSSDFNFCSQAGNGVQAANQGAIALEQLPWSGRALGKRRRIDSQEDVPNEPATQSALEYLLLNDDIQTGGKLLREFCTELHAYAVRVFEVSFPVQGDGNPHNELVQIMQHAWSSYYKRHRVILTSGK